MNVKIKEKMSDSQKYCFVCLVSLIETINNEYLPDV